MDGLTLNQASTSNGKTTTMIKVNPTGDSRTGTPFLLKLFVLRGGPLMKEKTPSFTAQIHTLSSTPKKDSAKTLHPTFSFRANFC